MGTIQEGLGQNCVLYTNAVGSDAAVVILAKKYYNPSALVIVSHCLFNCVAYPLF
jgi:hypothetical protein